MAFEIVDNQDNVIGELDVPALENEDTLTIVMSLANDGQLRVRDVLMSRAKGGVFNDFAWDQSVVQSGEEVDPALADKPVYETSGGAEAALGAEGQIVQGETEGENPEPPEQEPSEQEQESEQQEEPAAATPPAPDTSGVNDKGQKVRRAK